MVSEQSASTQFLNFLSWLQANQKRVLLFGGIGLFVVTVAAVIIYNQNRREVRASEVLSGIRVSLNPGAAPRPGLAEDYLKFAQDYAGTKAAARAVVQAAGTLYTDGKYAEAQQQFERVLREYPDSPWLAEAHLGVGASLEAQQKVSEAITKYEEVRRRFANAAIVDESKMGLARLYEKQNQPAEAVKIYDELLKGNPYSGLGAEAGMRQAELFEKHPDLKPKPPTPPAPITPSIIMTNLPTPGATNRVITITNLMPRATNIPGAATNVPGGAATKLPATGTNQGAGTNIPLLIRPNTSTNKPQ